MANRNWFEKVRSLLAGHVVIAGSFAPNGSSALVATSTYGKGFTVAYVSTGLYRITLGDLYAKLVSATVTLQLATGDDKTVQLGTYTKASKTLDIRVWDVGAAAVADVAADANNRINFNLVLSVSAVD